MLECVAMSPMDGAEDGVCDVWQRRSIHSLIILGVAVDVIFFEEV